MSRMLRASSPIVSRLGDNGIAPPSGTVPRVGFQALTPQPCAGTRSEPPVSEPSATKAAPDATATADPEDEPPVAKAGFHGLRAAPCNGLTPEG